MEIFFNTSDTSLKTFFNSMNFSRQIDTFLYSQEFDEPRNQSNLKQIENLKDLIQKLVRSLNPLGKLMDYVQEDIDSMQREYVKWNEIYKQAAIDLKREQR